MATSDSGQLPPGRDAEFIHGRDGCRRCGCTAFDPWQRNRWPLIERQLTRSSTLRWIVQHGYPEPPRSACYFCPNRGNAHWRQLRDEYPELWKSAVEVDEFVRDGMNEMRGQGFLHQSGTPPGTSRPAPPLRATPRSGHRASVH